MFRLRTSLSLAGEYCIDQHTRVLTHYATLFVHHIIADSLNQIGIRHYVNVGLTAQLIFVTFNMLYLKLAQQLGYDPRTLVLETKMIPVSPPLRWFIVKLSKNRKQQSKCLKYY